MKRELSNHAAVAKAIRAELKKHGISAKVRSQSFSMGNAVDVYLNDELPATVRKVKEFADQYQYGHFDGMQDLYEYSNRRDDIPQVKYVDVTCNYSDEIRQAVWDHIRSYYGGYQDAPESYKESVNLRVNGEYVSDLVWRILNGSAQLANKFWNTRKPRVKLQAA